MGYSTIIDTETLFQHRDDPSFVIVDCRFKLDDEPWGRKAFEEGHIAGASYASLDRDLSGPKTGKNGRHPLPDAAALIETFQRLGIGSGVQVVAYDQDTGMYASRLWWLLRWMGHDQAAVLDGGFARWVAEGRPIATGPSSQPRPAAVFVGRPRPAMVADLGQVERLAHDPEWRLIDARAPERFRGDVEPIDRVPGRIPGASNHFFKNNLDEAGKFHAPEQLRAQLVEAIGGVRPDHVICYCGSGVTACHDLLALEHAGIRGARLYPGSWSEWSSDPDRPVERG